jgi:hypothetical protein
LASSSSSSSSSTAGGGAASGDSISLLTFRRFFLTVVFSSDARLTAFFVLGFDGFVDGAGDSSIISSSRGSSCFSYKQQIEYKSVIIHSYFLARKCVIRTASSLII